MNKFLFSSLLTLCVLSASAQFIPNNTISPTSSADGNKFSSNPNTTGNSLSSGSTNVNASAPTNGFFESGSLERMGDKIFDVNQDSFDLENGNLNWKGKTFSIGNSRLVKARFERYLATNVSLQNFEAYQGILAEITRSLASSNDRLPFEDLEKAWKKLFDAAEYDADGQSSLTIANLVYMSWRMKGEYRDMKSDELRQEAVKDEVSFSLDQKTQYLEYANDKLNQMSSRKNRSQTNRTQGKAEIASKTKKLTEEIATLTAKTAVTQATATKAVLQFQSQIFTCLLERKFQQAQISSMFYRHIYRANVQDMQVGKKQIQELFPITNFVPTIDTFESIATEARKDIKDGMDAVNSLYDAGETYGALERLMETFALGEFDPILTLFPAEKRKVLHKLYKDAATIKSLADSKDWASIIEMIKEIEKISSDFPSKEILAKVTTAQQVSDMHIMAAKQNAALGRIDDVKASLVEAVKLWPLNPAIKEFNTELMSMATGVSKYVEKFDELFIRKDFRGIVAEAPEYALAFTQDKKRAQQLKEIVVKISQIDAFIAQAEELVRQNNQYFAWDILENASEIDSEDAKLALAIAKLAPEVSDYVKMLNRAKSAEKSKDFATSLNYYLAAQDIFPASQACRLGIERVADKYLD